jgi:hypothetical protein
MGSCDHRSEKSNAPKMHHHFSMKSISSRDMAIIAFCQIFCYSDSGYVKKNRHGKNARRTRSFWAQYASGPFKHVVLLYEDLSRSIIGAAIEVHPNLGPGYLESVYENCLAKELTARNIKFERKEPLEVFDFSVFSVPFFRGYCFL